MIDWTNPTDQVSDHFTVNDMCMLHQWNRLATADDGMDENMQTQLVILAQKLEQIRSFLQTPMSVHCCFRSHDYNKLISAPPNDVHSMGMACDFDCNSHLSTDEVKSRLMPVLEQMGIRMENNGTGASWIHIDTHPVMHARFFNP